MHLTWFGNRIFANEIKLGWGHPGLGVTQSSMTAILIRREEGIQTQGKCYVKTEAEIGVCICKPRNNKDCQQSSEAMRHTWKRFSVRISPRNQSCEHLEFGHLASRTVKRINSYSFITFSSWSFTTASLRNEYTNLHYTKHRCFNLLSFPRV